MALKITTLGVSIPGKVTRKHDEADNTTTLVLDEAQVREAYESLGAALDFFNAQAAQHPTLDAPEEPVGE